MMSLVVNRAETERRLAPQLKRFDPTDAVVYALPRGGLAFGAEIAHGLDVPLDVTFAGKICAPWEPSAAHRIAQRSYIRPILPLDRAAIVADDGSTSIIALHTVVRALRWHGAKSVIVARPVAAGELSHSSADMIDEVVYLDMADAAQGDGAALRAGNMAGLDLSGIAKRVRKH